MSLNDVIDINLIKEKKERKFIKSKEDFIRWSKIIHGENTYIYDLVIFVDSKTKMKLKCHQGHEFLVTTNSHLHKKSGCRKCADKMTGIKLMEKAKNRFIENAKKIHGDLYDYSEVDYKGSHKHVKIKCIYGHEFYIQPNVHLSVGQGCKYCNEELKKGGERILNVKPELMTIKWTTEKFIEEAKKIHKNKFNYDLTVFTTVKNKLIIKCENNHIFETLPYTHLEGSDCALCVNRKMTNKEFIEKSKEIFGEDTFDYYLVDYKGIYEKVNLICNEKKHNFFVTPNKHYISLGCPMCKNTTEQLFYDKLKNIYNNLSFQRYFKELVEIRTYPFDFCLEELKIIIEVDGDQHFREVKFFKGQTLEERQRVDFLKMLEVSKVGYSIIRIYQPDILLRTFEWLELIVKSINFIKKNNKPCLITIIYNKDYYRTYVNNYKNFVLSKNENLIDYHFINNLNNINNINEDINNEKNIIKDINNEEDINKENINKEDNKEEDINEEFYEIYEPSEYDPEDYIVPYEFDSDYEYEDNKENIDEFYSEDYYTSECYFRKMEKLAKLNLNPL